MPLPPIKLRLDGEELHLVASRELGRWGGYLNAPRGAYELVTPHNVAAIRHALMVPPSWGTEAVYIELRKQLEDGSALFFEVPPAAVSWEQPEVTNLFDLVPGASEPEEHPGGPSPSGGLHWIEVVCLSAADGRGYPGASARLRLPEGATRYLRLDARSAVRLDDLPEAGAVDFELSADSTPSGAVLGTPGGRYELGRPVSLSTRQRHVLSVYPNPRGFVSVELFIAGDPVRVGSYVLSTAAGEQAGSLGDPSIRVDSLVVPSASSFEFEGVKLPPRGDEASPHADDDHAEADAPPPIGPIGPIAPPAPDGPNPDSTEPGMSQARVQVVLEDGTALRGHMLLGGSTLQLELAAGGVLLEDLTGPVAVEIEIRQLRR